MKPVVDSVVDFGLRELGVKNEPRRLAAHFGRRSVPLLALAVLCAVVPCLFLRRVGAGWWVVAAFALAWTAVVFVLAWRTVSRAPVTVVKVRADGPNQASWLAPAPFVLATAAIALTGGLAVIPAAAVLLLAVVLVWRGRRRVPELVARVRALLAEDEAVLGDGLGFAQHAGRGAAAVQLVAPPTGACCSSPRSPSSTRPTSR